VSGLDRHALAELFARGRRFRRPSPRHTGSAWIAELYGTAIVLDASCGPDNGKAVFQDVAARVAELGVARALESALRGAEQRDDVLRTFDLWRELRRSVIDKLVARVARDAAAIVKNQWLRCLLHDRHDRNDYQYNFHWFFAALTENEQASAFDVEHLDLILERGAVDTCPRWHDIIAAILLRAPVSWDDTPRQEARAEDVKGLPLAKLVVAWASTRPEPLDVVRPLSGWLTELLDDLDRAVESADADGFWPVARFDVRDGQCRPLFRGELPTNRADHRRVEDLVHDALRLPPGEAHRATIRDLAGKELALSSRAVMGAAAARVSLALAHALRDGKESFAQRTMPSLKLWGACRKKLGAWITPLADARTVDVAIVAIHAGDESRWFSKGWHLMDPSGRAWSASALFSELTRAVVERNPRRLLSRDRYRVDDYAVARFDSLPAEKRASATEGPEFERDLAELFPEGAPSEIQAATAAGAQRVIAALFARGLSLLDVRWTGSLFGALQSFLDEDLATPTLGQIVAAARDRERGVRPPPREDHASTSGDVIPDCFKVQQGKEEAFESFWRRWIDFFVRELVDHRKVEVSGEAERGALVRELLIALHDVPREEELAAVAATTLEDSPFTEEVYDNVADLYDELHERFVRQVAPPPDGEAGVHRA
jgi:hypothetical protein